MKTKKEFYSELQQELDNLRDEGLFKTERVISSSQGSVITLNSGNKVLNFCSNNYLGLSSHPTVLNAAKNTLNSHGFGMSSVRFICGTQDIHRDLELKLADFLHTEDTILYAAAFDANGGVFEPLLGKNDAIISDSLNHASIIDGVRLCKSKRFRYKNNDMLDLENQLIESDKSGAETKLVVTDGVFSMDGYVAQLDKICDLAEKYNALVLVDECHATGLIGKTGRGTVELKNVLGRVDIITGTLGKALGGAMGGFTTGKKELIQTLRQKSRPYLFSNSLAPSIVGASIAVLDLLSNSTSLRDKLHRNITYFKERIKTAGFEIKDGDSAIVPIMLYEAELSQKFAEELLKKGIYVIGFFYPVVPKGQARIRVQLSAGHELEDIDLCVNAFIEVGEELNII
tara:strand:+ start:522 stop:1721 length:1200 start_codon:yes stop_codon:yes gene_type:complete